MRQRFGWVLAVAVCFACASTSASAAVTIEKVLPFTPAADSVRIQATISGPAGASTLVDVQGMIAPAAGGDAVWTGALGRADFLPNAPAVVEKSLEMLKVQPWSPGSPALYNLTVTATQAGQKVATKTVRFGFRAFESRNGNFYLNGHPIFMRGLAINPPGRTVPDAVGTSKQFAHDYVAYLRKQNVNLIRLTETNQDWFDACDELGMMVYQGFYGSPPTGLTKEETAQQKLENQDEAIGKQLPRDFPRSMAAYQAEFETYVRHPSIVIYVLSNELPYKGHSGEQVHDFLTRAYDHLSKWDHTRLYIGNAGYGEGHEGDVNDVHRYWGWYYNSFLTYYNLRDPHLFGDFDKNQPFTFSECVGCFTGPTGAWNYIERKQLAAGLGWTGHAPDQPAAAQAYQRFMVQQATEGFRRMREQNSRISGLMPFTITFHNWRGIKSFAEMKPTAAAEQFGTSYQPVLLSWENWTPQVYAGTALHLIAHVVNDAEDFSDLTDATLVYRLVGKDDAGTKDFTLKLPPVKYYAAAAVPVEISIPADLPSGRYVLRGQIQGKSSTNETQVFIAGNDWKQTPKPPARSIIVLNDNKTADAIAKLGFPIAPFKDFAALDPAKQCVVIGEEGWRPEIAMAKQQLAEFVAAGGRVLCLGQSATNFDASWLPARVEMLNHSVTDPEYPVPQRPAADQTHVNVERPDHPVFAGIDRDRLQLWSDPAKWDQSKPGFPRVSPVRFGYALTDPQGLSRTAMLADYDAGLQGVALAEMFGGKGAVMLSGFDLVSRAGLDPVADRMLANMVGYMADNQPHAVHPLIKDPIRWGDFSSEHGVIGGPISGLFRNTDWTPPPTEPDATPLTDAQGAWNTRPGDQFLPHGVRPRGPFHYTFNCSPRDDEKSADGSGVFYASIPAGRRAVVSKVRNDLKSPATLRVDVNDAKGDAVEVPDGKTITIRTPIPAQATDVGVRYTGNKALIIEETRFE